MAPPPGNPSGPPVTPEDLVINKSQTLMAEAGSVFAACAVVMILRCYVRAVMLKSFGVDDWVMVLAFILATATFICYVLEVPQGLGRHVAVVMMNQEAYRELLKIRLVHMCCVTIGLSVVKISASFFLLRLATKKSYRMFLWGIIVFMVAFILVSAATLIFQCTPVRAAWDLRLRPPPAGTGHAKCFSREVFAQIGLFNTIVNILTDFLLALLPVPLIWKLQLNIRTKISLILILSLGLFACVAGIQKALLNKTILFDPRRFIHDSYSMWNFVELDVGIIAASLPALKPLFNRFLDAARGLTSGQKASGYNDPNALGYHKQNERSNNAIMMNPYKSGGQSGGTSSKASGGTGKDPWGMARAKNSDDSILPLQDLGGKSNEIVITRDIRVE